MADSVHTTTLPVSRRRLLAGAGAVALAGASIATAAPGNDAELLDLLQRLRAKIEEDGRLNAHIDALRAQLPAPLEWTVDELKTHRIEGEKDRPRTLLPEEIERSDKADDPAQPIFRRTVDEREDGYSMSLIVVQPTVTAADRAAWRLRCRARRALYDAKHAAYDAARERLGINAGEKKSAANWDEWRAIRDRITATPATTVAGAVAKMKEAVDLDGTEIFEAELFVSALADLDRLVGGAA